MPHEQSGSTDRALMAARAVEAVIWGMPLVNFELLREAFVTTVGGRDNEVLYWSRLPDWHGQTLTPNPDTTYFLPFFDTTDGPVVIEIPAADDGSITGTFMNAWQCALEDVGPAGADEGAGGRYLILPPGFTEPIPPGYVVLACDTHRGYGVCRSNVASSSAHDVAAALDYGRRIRVYRLTEADDPPPTAFRDAGGVDFDSLIPYDDRYFDALNAGVQREPWLQRDRAMIHQLASLGIVKGHPFTPDDAARTVFAEAARAALQARFESSFTSPFFADTGWAVPVPVAVIEGQSSSYADPDAYPVDDRAVLFSIAFFSPKRLGRGQFYVLTIADAVGAPLLGARSYRLTVPPDAPVTLYWSATAYDRTTHGLIRGMPTASRASNTEGLESNSDGSVDVFFGPEPAEGRATNWVPTDPNGRFEVLFRFYGPDPSLFDGSWRLPDLHLLTPMDE